MLPGAHEIRVLGGRVRILGGDENRVEAGSFWLRRVVWMQAAFGFGRSCGGRQLLALEGGRQKEHSEVWCCGGFWTESFVEGELCVSVV